MTWWPQAWMPRNTNRPRTWPDVSAKTGNPIFDLSLHQALSPPIIWPSRPSASSCWIAMSRRELAVSEDRSGVSESGPPSPPAPSNNEASLNSCIRPSTTISRDGPHLHYFPQARERIRFPGGSYPAMSAQFRFILPFRAPCLQQPSFYL